MSIQDIDENDIAIVGMGIRVAGANTPEQYWDNLLNGRESVVDYSDDELLGRGVSKRTLANPNYVKAGVPLQNVDQFDPDFFGFSPKEAAILDPQHRQFYEVAWEALERSGHAPREFNGAIGVFAGCGMGAYFSLNLLSNPELVDNVGLFLLRHTGNDKDFLSTRVSYAFDLKGPSVNVQTACSTSLVATHLAAQSLLSFECDMALAGGVTIDIPHHVGYLYKEGEVLSPDGHCRAFDHLSKGTVFGSGAGAVVLRRLKDAIEDGDHIHAVIKGSAINNDGSSKVGYLAPSVEGQAAAVAEALAVADIAVDSIRYVECHGTGTPVGDPIEITALTRAFRESTQAKGFCSVGSVKTNIGHLDTAAGVASLIKTALAVENGTLPPSLNFEAPNPEIDFTESPFRVCAEQEDWSGIPGPRRAGVNSLGVGGTNAFVILEQAPASIGTAHSTNDAQFLLLSARTKKSLDDYSERLADWLEDNPQSPLEDISFTLAKGREAFEYRRVLGCASTAEAARLLRENDARRVFNHTADLDGPSPVFLFPGGGAQYFQMGQELYQCNHRFRAHIDAGLEVLKERWNADLSGIFHAKTVDRETVTQQLEQPSIQLPLTFLVEYALAQVLSEYGVNPEAMIGHSMGENTAACISGIMSFEETLGLIRLRGELFESTEPGGVLSVPMPADELQERLGQDLDLATSNSPYLAVASGAEQHLDALAQRLNDEGIDSQRVRVNVAAHSRLLDGILDEFRKQLQNMTLKAPSIPIVSNLTGQWLTDQQATDPDYWVQHLRNTVWFSKGVETLLRNKQRVFIEVGPGNSLGSFVRQQPNAVAHRVISGMRHPDDSTSDSVYLRAALGRLRAMNVEVSDEQLWPDRRQRLPLPTYAFQHGRYWVEPGAGSRKAEEEQAMPERSEELSRWFFEPKWVASGIAETIIERQTWLFFENDDPIAQGAMARLRDEGHHVLSVRPGDIFHKLGDGGYTLAPESGMEGYDQLVADLNDNGVFPDHVVHCWLLTRDTAYRPGSSFFHRLQNQGFYSLFYLAKALAKREPDKHLHISVLTNNAQSVRGEVIEHPDKATALGPVLVIPREMPNVTCKAIDLATPMQVRTSTGKRDIAGSAEFPIENVLEELRTPTANEVVAWRDNVRYLRQVTQKHKASNTEGLPLLRKGGVYMLTGGFGGIASVIVDWLVKKYQAKIVLIGRTPLPQREEWPDWLRNHDAEDTISKAIERVQLLENAGAEVLPIYADVTVADQMQDALVQIKTRFGYLNGIFHTAGAIRDSLIAMKSQREIEDVFSAKVYGSLVLDEVFGRENLDFVTLFGSSSAFIGPQGQIDYVAANSFINALASSHSATRPYPTIALNWGIWRDVGLVATVNDVRDNLDDVDDVAYPLFSNHRAGRDGLREVHQLEGTLSKNDWIIDEHRLKNGDALLPGTGYVELIRAALEHSGNPNTWRIENLTFEQPMFVPESAELDYHVTLTGNRDSWLVDIASRYSPDQPWKSSIRARVRRCHTKPSQMDLESLRANIIGTESSAEGSSSLRTRQEDHLNFGPRWRVLRNMKIGDGEAIGRLQLPAEFARDLDHYCLHPGLLDIATGFAMDLIPGYAHQDVAEDLWVPMSYASFEYYAPLPTDFISWVRLNDASSPELGVAAFDITLMDPQGNTLAEVVELTLRQTRGQFTMSASKADTANGETLAPAAMLLSHNASMGIDIQNGIRALQKVLTNPAPCQVIVSSMRMHDLLAQAQYLADMAGQTQETTRFERPDLDNEFVEARDEIEQSLAELWGKLLGVECIGVDDSFFDLGGHSLIAVRLFNEIRERFGHDLPISVLMQSPTINDLATIVRGGPLGQPESIEAYQPAAEKAPQFQYVVPMHSGAVGRGTPLFMVAGMFGNVLNLSHLAHLMGEERPFYALQARGLYGDSEPHETFEESASAYIEELRQVQPEGPYLLGGYSGGGLIAYEMAYQLERDGEQVTGVILLDTPAPCFPRFSIVDKASMIIQGIRTKGPGYLIEKVKTRIRWEREQRERAAAGPDNPLSFQSQKIGEAFLRALQRFEVPKLGAPVTLYRPKLNIHFRLSGGRQVDNERNYVFEDNGWQEYAANLNVIEIPGDHDSMVLEPNVRVLVAMIRKTLARSTTADTCAGDSTKTAA